MSEPRKKADGPIVAALVLAVVLVLAGVYVWGYFATSFFMDDNHGAARIFRHHWQAVIYYPAVCVESVVARRDIEALSPADYEP